jgi:hypothetical protein
LKRRVSSLSDASRPVPDGVRLKEEKMDEILTFDQIKARYAPDWVLIVSRDISLGRGIAT